MAVLKDVKIVGSLTEDQRKSLWELYQEEWWSKERTLQETQAIIQSSQLVMGVVLESGRLIGFLRVLTDFIAVAVIYDVMIHKAYRNRGLGTALIKEIVAHPKLKNVEFIDLFCKPEMNFFYQRLGFDVPRTGTNMLRLKERIKDSPHD